MTRARFTVYAADVCGVFRETPVRLPSVALAVCWAQRIEHAKVCGGARPYQSYGVYDADNEERGDVELEIESEMRGEAPW